MLWTLFIVRSGQPVGVWPGLLRLAVLLLDESLRLLETGFDFVIMEENMLAAPLSGE